MKYTEEEKKAIENLNEILTHKNDVDIAYGYNIERPYPIGREKIAQLEIIKNLLEKQQKETEKKNKIITEVERYARGIKDEELLLILKKDEIEKLVNECEELLGE